MEDNQTTDNTETISSFEEALDFLGEKRSSTREDGFKRIISELRSRFAFTLIEKKVVTITEAIKKGLKKGNTSEQIICCQTFPLFCITLGVDSEEVQKEMAPILEEIIINGTSDDVRVEAITALGQTHFIANPDEHTTIELMKKLATLFENPKTSSDLRTVALDIWALLLTTVSIKHAYDILIPDHIASVTALLKSDDLDLRLEAGETLTLLVEVVKSYEDEKYTLDSLNGYIDTDDLIDTLTELSLDRNKSRSKKDKIKQRASFKEVLAYIESGEEPKDVIEIKQQKFTFDSWTQIKQLEALRELLGTGFQPHFESNDLLHQIFDITFQQQRKTPLTGIQKRMMYSPIAKARTKDQIKQRAQKEQLLNETDE